MYFKLKRGEYIVIFEGEKNNELEKIIENINDSTIKFKSKNAYVVSCLQNGIVIGNGKGKTTVNIYKGEERIKKIRVIVLPGKKNKYPILVNRFNGVSDDFIPNDLVKIEKGSLGWNMQKDVYICKKVAVAYNEMSKEAAKENVYMRVTQGYRSYDEQKNIIKELVKQKGQEEAFKQAAPVGFSEHHTGLAIDIGGMKKSDGTYVTSNTEVYKWIEKNCYKFGFMIKNLKGKEHITGTKHEPWHIRYIGNTDISKVLHQKEITLDEYLNEVNNDSLKLLFKGSNLDKIVDKYLTLEDICKICNIEVLKEIRDKIDFEQNIKVSQIKMSKLKINSGDIFFCDQQIWQHISKEMADKIAIEAFNDGASLLFSKRKILDVNGNEIPTIIVNNPLDCIVRIGKYIRNQYSIPTIGITGTCGKTTTKNLVYLALAGEFKTHTNNANANDVNNVFEFITKLDKTYQFYVQEVSGAGPGRVEASSDMLGLNASIVTNIGNYHLDLYKSVDNIAYDKLKIVDNLNKGGIAILNLDDDILCGVKEKSNKNIIYVSEINPEADYYIKNCTQLIDGLIVNIVDNYTSNSHKEYEMKIDIIGKHNAFNIAAAFAIGQWAGIKESNIINNLQKYHSQGFRQVLKQVGEQQLYLDCFSLTEKSTITSIKTLCELPCEGRKVAVIGGAGHFGSELHSTFSRIAEQIKSFSFDLLVCFGEKTKALYSGVEKQGNIETVFCSTMEELISFLHTTKHDDIILFKAVLGECLPFAVDSVFGTDICINSNHYRREFGRRVKSEGYVYMIFSCFDSCMVSLDYYGKKADKIVIRDEIEDIKITYINKNSFKNKHIKSVKLGCNIIGIGENAFKNCVLLENMEFDRNLKYIGSSAFENCYGLEKINLPEGLVHIDQNAFKNCKNLKYVYIPDSVKYIGEGAFKGCNNIVFKYESCSYAEKYVDIIQKENHVSKTEIFCLGNIRVTFDDNYNEFEVINYFLNCSDFSLGNLELSTDCEVERNKLKLYIDNLRKLKIGLLLSANESSESLLDAVDTYNRNTDNMYKINESVFVKKINGMNIAIINYMTFAFQNSEDDNYMRYSKKKAKFDIDKVKELGAEFIIVYIHWGYRGGKNSELSDGQKKVSKELVEMGVDVIIGSHPERVQDCTFLNKKNHNTLCCYSLGDFCNTGKRNMSEPGIILCITINRSDEGGISAKYRFVPISNYKNKKNHTNYIIPLNYNFVDNIALENFDQVKNKLLNKIDKRIVEIDNIEEF